MKQYYDEEKAEKEYRAETKESRSPYRSKVNRGDSFGERSMLFLRSGEALLFYILIHSLGTFAVQTVVCLFFTNDKDIFLFSGAVGAIIAGTIAAMIREKEKLHYAFVGNLLFFLDISMYVYMLVSGLSSVLYGVQL